jgi:hypothetical protein
VYQNTGLPAQAVPAVLLKPITQFLLLFDRDKELSLQPGCFRCLGLIVLLGVLMFGSLLLGKHTYLFGEL